jgi:hypothetical protein
MQTNRQSAIPAAGSVSNSRPVAILQVCSALLIAFGLALPAEATLFSDTNLVTDNQAANPALITDLNLVNAWGISHSGGSPFWVSDNGTGKATLYNVDPVTNVPTIQGLVVSIPPVPTGTPTGQVFANVAGSFNGDTFLFVSEDGTVSGGAALWAPPRKRSLSARRPTSTREARSRSLVATPISMRPISVTGRSMS